MTFRAETPMRQEKKGHYDELNELAGHNTADLRVQYVGPYPLIKEKGVFTNLQVLFGTIIQPLNQ